jgi:putative tryptophan/tyrosine transport system substrate-binding protein
MIIRSALAVVLAFVLLAVPLAGRAQQAGKVYRIGWISGLSSSSAPHLSVAMIQALRDLGWVEGRNLIIDYGYAEGRFDRLPALVAGLLRAKPDVILALGDQPIKAAKEATATVPIVMIACDAVAAGLIASLARPGGNITGVTCMSREIAGKRIELLRDSLPHLGRLAVLYNPDDPGKAIEWRETEAAGRALGLKVTAVPIRDPKEFQSVFAAIAQERADALIILGDPFTILYARELVDLAAKHRLPVMSAYGEFVTSGGLMSYGPNLVEMRRTAAVYIDKVLRGARPADLPVEQPTKFELVVNLKTEKALGLTIPHSLLLRADQVIQ